MWFKVKYFLIAYAIALAVVSKLLAFLGHTGRRRVGLGHTLNTKTLMKTDEQKKKKKV